MMLFETGTENKTLQINAYFASKGQEKVILFLQRHRNNWNLQYFFEHRAVRVSSVKSMNFHCFAVNLGHMGHTGDCGFFLWCCEDSWLQNTLLAVGTHGLPADCVQKLSINNLILKYVIAQPSIVGVSGENTGWIVFFHE